MSARASASSAGFASYRRTPPEAVNATIARVEGDSLTLKLRDRQETVDFSKVLTSNGDPVNVNGYSAGPGWDAFTGLGSPKTAGVVSGLAAYWSAGQGTAATVQSAHALSSSGNAHAQPH